MEDFQILGLQVEAAFLSIYSILRRGGCQLSQQEVKSKLLWICDLQDLVPADYHQSVCIQWNTFWELLWQYRQKCGQLTGHSEWIQQPADYFRHPNHYTCSRCGKVKVDPSN
jgi:hypothetical protein